MLLCQCQGSKVTIFSFPHFRPPVFFLPYDLILGLYLIIKHTFFIFSRLLYIRFIDKIVKVNLETAMNFLFCFLFSFPSRVMMLLFHKLQEFTAWIETSISFYSTCEDFFSSSLSSPPARLSSMDCHFWLVTKGYQASRLNTFWFLCAKQAVTFL